MKTQSLYFYFLKILSAMTASYTLKMASFFKISYVVGSFGVYFSPLVIGGPLIGAYAGHLCTFLTFATLAGIRWWMGELNSLSQLAFVLPGYGGALYWMAQKQMWRTIVPLTCMVLFILHPTGFAAASYSLYWLIPIACAQLCNSSILARAFGSTFTAHAIGSVIWLYTVPLPAHYWIALIPVVALERTFFACSMVFVYTASKIFISYAQTHCLNAPEEYACINNN